MRKISTVISIIIYIIVITVGFGSLKSIPQPCGIIWNCIFIIGKVVVGFIVLIVGGVLTVGLTTPLWKKVESFNLPAIKKEIFSKSCVHLRNYYGLQESYIITKCFDATDKKFQNHDVCIFVVGDELRITTDLIHGFLYGERDLGCYAFKKYEIVLSKRLCDKHLMIEMRAGKTIFLLGYKARSFIEKNFIGKETDYFN
ncbi:MAG: hypothetical protein IJA12_04745 [Oscillospiraceae bacterium]|nr:hypothetical protein [Oscillospiraceae bacterium]